MACLYNAKARNALLTASAMLSVLSARGHAQQLDYESFELLFGEPVTLAATGTPKRASEAPADIIIITAEDIRRSGARDLPDLLDRLGGLSVVRTGPLSANASIRGYDQGVNRRLQVTLDGRQVYNDFFSFTLFANIPVQLDEIRQIEIVKGVSTALYGFNAVSGAINIVTFEAGSDRARFARGQAGDGGYVLASAGLAHEIGDFGVRISGGAAFEDAWANALPPLDIDLARDAEAFNGRLVADWRISDSATLRFEAAHSETEANNASGGEGRLFGELETTALSLRLDWSVGNWVANARVYTNGNDDTLLLEDIVDDATGEAIPLNYDQRLTVVSADAVRKIGTKHSIRGSVEYRRSGINTAVVDNGRLIGDQFAIGGVWDWRPILKLNLTVGGRFDHLRIDRTEDPLPSLPFTADDAARQYNEPSLNAAISYRPTNADTIRILYGRGALLPNLIERGAFLSTFPIALIPGAPQFDLTGVATGTPEIDATHTQNVQVTYTRNLPRIGGRFNVTGFYETSRDIIRQTEANLETFAPIFAVGGVEALLADLETLVPILQQTALPTTYAGYGDSRSLGVEVGLQGTIGRWRYAANYTFVDVEDDDPPPADILAVFPDTIILENGVIAETTAPRYDESTPAHEWNVQLGYDVSRFSFDVFGEWRSGYAPQRPIIIESDDAPFGAFTDFDIGDRFEIGGRFGVALTDRLMLSVQSNNLLDDRWAEFSTFEVERRIWGELAYRW